ncbi:tigger transposable element-derived protein 6-like [Eupeodes corollae]|uniref:tigger transposable element-derived protein 6-like n=1 Tax=Eupeodes corollae TaxID=290404 RepID=UPI0024908CF7|nr:tigger transposable element-derived protein 6-like [Eupeodes corollae]
MSGRKYTSLSIKQKLNILKESQEKSKTELCSKYKCSLSTLNRVIRNVEQIKNKSRNFSQSRKREPIGSCKKVEEALLTWFGQMRSKGAAVSCNIVMEKAKQFAVMLDEDFSPNAGWLWRWQKRNRIVFKRMQGEMSSADFEGAESFRSLIPTLVQNYAACDIFNADESGLFYKALPTSTLTQRGSNVHGFKSSKDRLTLLFICNATGDYKKIIVIGKTKKPRCFKNKSVPLEYYSNRKAWMTQDIWTQILFSLDEEMIKQQRKIILFVDNAACHKKLDNLKNINLQFLPPNATSIIQPLDQGIIHCFKAYYRQNIIRKQIAAFEAGKTIEEFSKSLTFLQAMHISKYCLWLMTPSTVRNCFRKVTF